MPRRTDRRTLVLVGITSLAWVGCLGCDLAFGQANHLSPRAGGDTTYGLCITVDGSASDPALACMSNHNWAYPPKTDNNTDDVANNIGQCIPTVGPALQPPAIIGHGTSGDISAGSGSGPITVGQDIGVTTESDWKPKLSTLAGRQFDKLTLLSCNTGAGTDGAQLVQDLANTVKQSVTAATGKVFCDPATGDISFETGNQWQTAAPSATAPPPLAAPVHVFQPTKGKLKLNDGKAHYQLDLASKPIAVFSSNPPTRFSPFTLNGADALEWLRYVDFANPSTIKGEPLAKVTAYLRLTFSSQKESIIKEYTIFNDDLLQDQANHQIYYYVLPEFSRHIHTAFQNSEMKK